MMNVLGKWGMCLVLALVMSATVAVAQEAAVPSVDIAFGTDIDRENRELVGEATTFAAGIDRNSFSRAHMVPPGCCFRT